MIMNGQRKGKSNPDLGLCLFSHLRRIWESERQPHARHPGSCLLRVVHALPGPLFAGDLTSQLRILCS